MINYHHVFKDINILKDFLCSYDIQSNAKKANSILVQAFCSQADYLCIDKITDAIEEKIPKAVLVGSTTAGEIADGQLLTSTTVLAFTFFENASVKPIAITCSKGDEFACGKYLGKSIMESGIDIAGVLLLATPLSIDVTKLFKGMQHKGNTYPIFGGGAGVYNFDNLTSIDSMIFLGKNFYVQGVIAVVFLGENLHISSRTYLGWQPLSKEMTITETDGRLVKKIDDVPAFDIYRRYLKIKNDKNFFINVLEFPFLFKRNGKIVARVPFFAYKDGNIEFATELNAGEKFRIGYGDPGTIIKNAIALEKSMYDFEPDVIFLFNCVCHRYLMQSEANLEIERFNAISPTVGFYTYGEFCGNNHKIQAQNSTMVVVGMREGEKCKNSKHLYNSRSYKEKHLKLKDPYADKHNIIISRLVNFIGVVTEELEKANDELTKIAEIDKVTQIFNRLKLDDILKHEFDSSEQFDTEFSVIMIDIDRFKEVNDIYGHNVGDEVLIQIVNIIKKNIRDTDYLGRWGGEEFLIVLPNTNLENAGVIANRIRTSIDSWDFPATRHHTCSFGVARYSHGDDQNMLILRADKALYEAKNSGRNKVVLSKPVKG